jgi:hypothetical protein
MADDDGVMYSVAADYELDVGNLAVFYGRGPPASSAMTEYSSSPICLGSWKTYALFC